MNVNNCTYDEILEASTDTGAIILATCKKLYEASDVSYGNCAQSLNSSGEFVTALGEDRMVYVNATSLENHIRVGTLTVNPTEHTLCISAIENLDPDNVANEVEEGNGTVLSSSYDDIIPERCTHIFD